MDAPRTRGVTALVVGVVSIIAVQLAEAAPRGRFTADNVPKVATEQEFVRSHEYARGWVVYQADWIRQRLMPRIYAIDDAYQKQRMAGVRWGGPSNKWQHRLNAVLADYNN